MFGEWMIRKETRGIQLMRDLLLLQIIISLQPYMFNRYVHFYSNVIND